MDIVHERAVGMDISKHDEKVCVRSRDVSKAGLPRRSLPGDRPRTRSSSCALSSKSSR